MSLYHDYRPTDLDEVVGNKSTVKSLKAMLDRDEDMPHAILFTGGSGCGKTTLGRILANAMGVYDPEQSKGMNPNYREVDSADFRGIDSIREIRQQMNLTPMGGDKARVWLLDECFTGDTQISTPTSSGSKKIKTIKRGDKVYCLGGVSVVTNTFQKKIPLDRLVRVELSNGKVLYCSDGHEFFTSNGWVKAINLQKKDPLLFSFDRDIMSDITSKQKENARENDKTVQGMRKTDSVLSEPSRKVQQTVLRSKLFSEEQNQEAGNSRSPFRRKNEKETKRISKGVSFESGSEKNTQSIFRKNDKKQSHVQSEERRKNDDYQRNQRNSSYMEREEGRKRPVYGTPSEIGDGVKMGNGNSGADKKEVALPNELQIRRSQSETKNRDRGGRTESQIEESYKRRQEKAGPSGIVRVDNIKVYQRGDNDVLFSGHIGNKERSQGYVTLYDISVEKHPSYFAEGVAVHNCHKLTNEAQNALLKALEDPPNHVYFILCTTNPEKLLKTIKSRCTTFNLEPLGKKTMLRFLNEICDEEEVEVPQDVLKLIAKNSQGHPRAALVALDKIIDLDEDDMLEAAEQVAEEESQVIDLCQALIKRSPWKKVSEILNGLKDKEPESVRWAVLGYCNSVMLNSATPNPNAYLVMDAFRENFYDTKHFGLTLACYEALEAE